VAGLKEFELPLIKLNENNVEEIPTVKQKTRPKSSPMKFTVESDGLLASYIACLERLEDLEKDRSLSYNNNETNSSSPKANPYGSYPILAPLHVVNNANYTYGMPPNPPFGQNLQFQPHRPNMAAPVEPVQGTGLTGKPSALEMVPNQPMPLSVVLNLVISNPRPHYSTTMNTLAPKTIIPDHVFQSYRLPQAKITPYLNKTRTAGARCAPYSVYK
jgi:hypothetical protein